jgi:hypothetical protein
MNQQIKERVVNFIDVNNMTLEEACQALGIKYTPWYKDWTFWSLCMVFCSPSIIALLEILR